MKARRLPQKGIVLEVIENFQEIIWSKIALGVKGFILYRIFPKYSSDFFAYTA